MAWLTDQSMLVDATEFAKQFSGQGSMWQNPFADPDPRAAIEKASVWFTAYPISMITKPGSSFLGTLGDPDLWEAFADIGIDGVHTGPVKKAGGLEGWDETPSVDGHFDRISTHIDEAFGTEDEFRSMCEVAAAHGGTIIDDIVPGHTGKGADFRLAEMKVGDYPGIYHMVEIPEHDWHLLPEVSRGKDSINLDYEAEDQLEKAGYIIGRLQRVIFHDPGIKDTNWSATGVVLGPDGVERRWVYLHYFKEGQPSINWLDPTFAGMRLVIGDALHSLGDLGSGALRLDANGFLGVEKSTEGEAAWSEGHPLSEAANQLIASMVRKVGGFTFQELNLTIDDIRNGSERGADLSYDFVNRPAYHHAMATGDTEFLRLTLKLSRVGRCRARVVGARAAEPRRDDVRAGALRSRAQGRRLRLPGRAGDRCPARRDHPPGSDRRPDRRQRPVQRHLHHERDRVDHRDDHRGVARLHRPVPTQRGRRRDDQAGASVAGDVQRLAAWSVRPVRVGPVRHVDPGAQAGRLGLSSGDTRWIHRSAYDLMDYRPEATESLSKMPRGVSLYGSLPAQLEDRNSFASRLSQILTIRRRHGIATGQQLDVPQVSNKAMLVMVHQLDRILQVTVLNFSPSPSRAASGPSTCPRATWSPT